FRVRKVSESVTRFEAASELTAFVNREPELALILDRWAWARGGHGQVVLISGEPGIGKSRLVQELQERIADQPHGRVRCQCSPYFGQSALYPVIVGLRRIVGLLPEDVSEAKLTKLEAFLTGSGGVIGEMVPLLAALLSIPISN